MTTHGQCTEKCGHVESRKKWPPGPWNNEPDRVEFQHAGLQCLLHRARGHWCGYVGLPPSHPLHGKDEGGIDVEVHGGLTYAAACQGPICHVPAEGEDETLWWFGFDCAHCGDVDPESLTYLTGGYRDGWYKNVDYVTHETKRLAEQLQACGLASPAGGGE